MHVTPRFINLHWLPIAARIKFKALMFAYKTTSGSAPLYLNSLRQTYVPSRSLRSASEHCFIVHLNEAQSFSQTFKCSLLVESCCGLAAAGYSVVIGILVDYLLLFF